ncbi:hypothetical protein BRADI_3g31040v3 [Brachypodium distachyon]|uniref:Uncharacterized protein n=1 Tax=Brachypodium distachyon TaxID=15368 RepID=A0A2K2D0C1_BRADI|nr:hypothetical protein BRADI_3g31040v3 [Brachypodium distachyon]
MATATRAWALASFGRRRGRRYGASNDQKEHVKTCASARGSRNLKPLAEWLTGEVGRGARTAAAAELFGEESGRRGRPFSFSVFLISLITFDFELQINPRKFVKSCFTMIQLLGVISPQNKISKNTFAL